MTAQIIDFQKIRADASCESLHVDEDDFSVKVSSTVDRLFWVRLVEHDDGEIIITDFNRGSMSQITLNAALRMAMARMFASHPEKLRFKNIKLSHQDNGADETLAMIRNACDNVAHKARRSVNSVDVVRHLGKTDIVVALS